MGRLVVLVTSPRLPAGLLSGAAWEALRRASRIATDDVRSPLARALTAEALTVEASPAAGAADLLALAAADDVVWLAADDAADDLLRRLAAEVAGRGEGDGAGPDVEVLVGSFDPVGARLLDLVEVMDTLRRECPWDRAQTHESLVRYLVEETYETVEAVETGDRDHLREELGDLLLQVMFHARVAQEHDCEPFGIDDVAAGIVAKLIRRHPHVFPAGPGAAGSAATHATAGSHGGARASGAVGTHDVTTADGVQGAWEDIKATEKARASAMDGIPPGLPALSLADKVVGRLHGTGGIPAVHDAAPSAHTQQSLGDALFALVASARAAGLDAEQALRLRVRREMDDVRVREQRALRDASDEPG